MNGLGVQDDGRVSRFEAHQREMQAGLNRETLPAAFCTTDGSISSERQPRGFERSWAEPGIAPRQPGGDAWQAVVRERAGVRAGPGQESWLGIGQPLLALEGTLIQAVMPAGESPEVEKSCRLLLVEDNSDVRELLADGLSLMGYAVETAETAEEALRQLEEELPDVLLSDIGLPGMDGLELMRRVRRLVGADRLIAFATTGLGAEEDIRQAREAGFDGYFTKPIDVFELDQSIRLALRQVLPSPDEPGGGGALTSYGGAARQGFVRGRCCRE